MLVIRVLSNIEQLGLLNLEAIKSAIRRLNKWKKKDW